MTCSFWCLAMSKTWVPGVSGLQVDFGQVTLPSPHRSPSIMALMTTTSSAKPWESYSLKLLYSSQTQRSSNFLTPSATIIPPGCRYKTHLLCALTSQEEIKSNQNLVVGGKTLLSSRGGWGGNGRIIGRWCLVTKSCATSRLLSLFGRDFFFFQSVGKTCPAHPGNSRSVQVREGHGRTFIDMKIYIPICDYIAFTPCEVNDTTYMH